VDIFLALDNNKCDLSSEFEPIGVASAARPF